MKKYWLVLVIFVLLIGNSQPVVAAVSSNAPLLAIDSPTAIPGQYIIVYKPGISSSSVEQAAQNVSALGGTVLYQYSSALVGYAAILPDLAVSKLRQDPGVAYIEADQVMSIDTTQSPATWGIDRIDQ